jgi:hypothetical protein
MGGSILISPKLLVVTGFYLLLISFPVYTQTTLDLETLYGKSIESTETTKDYYARDFIIVIRVNNSIPNSPKYEIFPVKPLEFISIESISEILSEIFPKSGGFNESNGFTFNNRCNGWQVKFFENKDFYYKVTKSSTCQPATKIIIEEDIRPLKFSRIFKL